MAWYRFRSLVSKPTPEGPTSPTSRPRPGDPLLPRRDVVALASASALSGLWGLRSGASEDQVPLVPEPEGPPGPDRLGCLDVRSMGAMGDGGSHPLWERFSSLKAARRRFPTAESLDEELDGAAIQTALDTCCRVFVPPGTYDLGERGLTLDGQKHLAGAGWSCTVLKYRGPDAALRVNSGRRVTTARWSVRDLTIDCGGLGHFGLRLGQALVGPRSANVGVVQEVRLTGAREAGLHLDHSQINALRSVDMSNNPGDGCRVEQTTGSANTDTQFYSCTFRLNGGRGLHADGGSGLSFYGCTFESNGREGARLIRRDDVTVAGGWVFDRCWFEANGAAAGAEPDCTLRPGESAVHLHLDSCGSTGWERIEVRSCHFSQGGSRPNLFAGKCDLLLWFPSGVVNGADGGTSATSVVVWDDKNPSSWHIGGPDSRLVFQKLSTEELVVAVNSGGAWQRSLVVRENRIQAASDVEILDPSRGVILTAPGGGRYRVVVDPAGNLGTRPV